MRAASVGLMFALLAALPGPARADCDQAVKQVADKVADVANPRIKALIVFDLTRANRELGEGDEQECMEAMGHAQRLLLAPP